MSSDEYYELIKTAREACGPQGIGKTLDDNDVDIIMGPGDGLMFSIFGTAGS
jgi:amidase